MICPTCKGEKKLLGLFPVYGPDHTGERKPYIELPCRTCNATGEITEVHATRIEYGRALRAERISRGVGLREEAEMYGMDPSELSDIEHGRLPQAPAAPEKDPM